MWPKVGEGGACTLGSRVNYRGATEQNSVAHECRQASYVRQRKDEAKELWRRERAARTRCP